VADDVHESNRSRDDSVTSPLGQAQLVGLERLTRRHQEVTLGRLMAAGRGKTTDAESIDGASVTARTHRQENLVLSTLAFTWKRLRGRLSGDPGPADCDLVREAYSAMNACIGCRACGQECPLKQELPQLKDCFVEAYHQARDPGPADGIIAGFEMAMPWIAATPRLARWALESRLAARLLRTAFGVTGLPKLAPRPLRELLRERSQSLYTPATLARLPAVRLEHAVVLVQDVFTSFLEPQVVLAALDLLEALGYRPLTLRYYPTGRGLQIRGYAAQAARAASREAEALSQIARLGLPMVGLDPVVTLGRNASLRKEHPDAARVALLQDWLNARSEETKRLFPRVSPVQGSPHRYWLLPHCSEREISADGDDGWQRVFDALGLRLEIWAGGCRRSAATGSCELSAPTESLDGDAASASAGHYLATGYPCRRELTNDALGPVRHPVEVLADLVSPTRRKVTLDSTASAP
jgi:Fe-S oxidoreductase